MRTGQDHQAAGYCWVIHDGGEAYSVGLIDCNAREGVGTGDREYPGAARPSEWSDAGRQRHE